MLFSVPSPRAMVPVTGSAIAVGLLGTVALLVVLSIVVVIDCGTPAGVQRWVRAGIHRKTQD